MKYPLSIKMDLTVAELYELRLAITKKLKNELAGREVTELSLHEWQGPGSIEYDNILLCELNSCEVRIHLLEDLLHQIDDAFTAAQAQDGRIARRTRKLLEAEL